MEGQQGDGRGKEGKGRKEERGRKWEEREEGEGYPPPNENPGYSPAGPSSAIVLATVSGRNAAGPPGPRVSQMFLPP